MIIARMPLPTDQSDFDEIVARGRPVLFEGAISDWQCTKEWTLDRLRQLAGHREVTASVSPNRIYTGDPKRGHYSSAERRSMRFSDFLDAIAREDSGEWLYLHKQEIGRLLPELREQVGVPRPLHCEPTLRVYLWMGRQLSVTQLHHDFQHNLLAQIRGRKRVYLISPFEEAPYYRYPLKALDTRASWHLSVVPSVEQADEAVHPGFTNHDVGEVVVAPGDLLYVPIFWWHEVHSLDQLSISLSYWWGSVATEQHDAAVRVLTSLAEQYEQLSPEWKKFCEFFIQRHIFERKP
jgi:lysine-specific demethylase 8